MAQHIFHLKAEWPGGRNSVGKIETGELKTSVSIPPEMDGPGVGTNPDEMLLGAAATCYIITLAAMLERSRIEVIQNLKMTTEGTVEVKNGIITYKNISHMPIITVHKNSTETTISKIKRLVHKAEDSCMISRAVRGNVEIQVNETIEMI
ncbi:SACOL1771 family peroxiredoxin [Falsibacillus albus]|uniref:SACOL1771 family peroxiredoxin n=1 Tax=Falsibacillus albus TaxID=2478915 RepID=A0A3L7K4C9_9BACI|nr:SACOL1771 family peroxiredoxin [Falsibacillus albus]RLQ97139.1 SACOL1771 family peroxiredoxin [Falsibacillus albus]